MLLSSQSPSLVVSEGKHALTDCVVKFNPGHSVMMSDKPIKLEVLSEALILLAMIPVGITIFKSVKKNQ